MESDASTQPNFDATPGGVNGAALANAIDNFGATMDQTDSSSQPNIDQGASDPLFQYELATDPTVTGIYPTATATFLSPANIPSWTWYALGGLALVLVIAKKL